jgi:hypothetical protein
VHAEAPADRIGRVAEVEIRALGANSLAGALVGTGAAPAVAGPI